MSGDEIRELRAEFEAGLKDWDPLQEWWYPTEYTYYDVESGEFKVDYYKAPWPGAPRVLSASGSLWGDYSRDVQWLAEFGEQLGLDLPPAWVMGSLANPFPQGWRYREEDAGFYPPLEPGVNVVWAVNADLTDASLRPECPEMSRIEVLNAYWAWPDKNFAASWEIFSYEQFVADPLSRQGPGYGDSIVWSEEDHAAYFRATVNTPYGWYTFDIELLEMRPADTARDSWDTINLWGLWDNHYPPVLAVGQFWYGAEWGPGLEVWPAFDPWSEVVPSPGLRREGPSGPTAWSGRYLVPREGWPGSGALLVERGEYMRITCE